MERFRTPEEGEKLVVVDGRRLRYRGLAPTRPWHAALELIRAKNELERLARRVPLGAPWLAERSARLDGETYAEWLERNVRTRQSRALLRLATETLYAAAPEALRRCTRSLTSAAPAAAT